MRSCDNLLGLSPKAPFFQWVWRSTLLCCCASNRCFTTSGLRCVWLPEWLWKKRGSQQSAYTDSCTGGRGFLSPGYRWATLSSIPQEKPRERHNEAAKERKKREKKRRRGRECQIVWPFLQNPTPLSAWEINLLSSLDSNLTLICLHPHVSPTSSSPFHSGFSIFFLLL